MAAVWATHDDARGAVIDVSLGEGSDATASVAGQRRCGDIASNEPFSSWRKTFTNPRLRAAIVDRLKFAGQIIETVSTSYRLDQARKGPSRKWGQFEPSRRGQFKLTMRVICWLDCLISTPVRLCPDPRRGHPYLCRWGFRRWRPDRRPVPQAVTAAASG